MFVEHTLMHKNLEVMDLEVDEPAAHITKIMRLIHPEHIPLGTSRMAGGIDRQELNDWLKSRSIPASRSGL
jgi:hypothetical protein